MEIHAWIQMGVERRETVIEVPNEEFEAVKSRAVEEGIDLEVEIEEYVRDWLSVQYGWGWSAAGFTNDFGIMEGGSGSYAVTNKSAIPNTESVRLDCPRCRQNR